MDAGVAVVVVAKKNLEDLGKDAAANVGGKLVLPLIARAAEDEKEREEESEEEEGALDGDANFISNYLYNGY